MRRIVLSTAVVTSFLVAGAVSPALALNARTFVSAVGDDSNPCSRTQPCLTFQHAHDVTEAGGVIEPITPGGYGSVIITKSISILNHGVGTVGMFPPPGGNAITINSGDHVVLEGLSINGLGADQTNGIVVNLATSLAILNCNITDMSSSDFSQGSGILFNVVSARLYFVVSGSFIASNHAGVQIKNGGSYYGTLEKSILLNNDIGLNVTGSSPTNTSSIVVDTVTIEGSTISAISDSANSRYGLYLTRSQITGNSVSIGIANNAAIYSNGDNRINGNLDSNLNPNPNIRSNVGLQ